MLYQSVQEELPPQHAEHQLVSERAVLRPYLVVRRRQQDGRERALLFDAPQDVEGRAPRR